MRHRSSCRRCTKSTVELILFDMISSDVHRFRVTNKSIGLILMVETICLHP